MDLITIGLLIFIVFLLLILSWVWPPDSPWSPWWRTSGKKARAACKLAKISKSDIVYELGSGDATFLVVAAKKFGAKGVGIEIDPIRHLIAWFNVRFNNLSGKVTLKRENFFKSNIRDATVVFVYLVPRVLEKLKPRLFAELEKGTRVISYKYKFELDEKGPMKFVSEDKDNEMYLYKIT